MDAIARPSTMNLKSVASQLLRTSWFWPALIAAAAWGTIVVALDPAGDHPGLYDGPGLTVDEPFNVGQGVALADRLFAGDVAGFRRVDAGLPDHPPLGRVWIGVCHELAWLFFPPANPGAPYSITCARTGSATAFAALVLLVGSCAGRWYGRWGGAAAALALVLMPRLFGHAHLAALETSVNLTCTAVVLFLAEKWGAPPQTKAQRGSNGLPGEDWKWNRALGTAAVGGLLFGLALLTKVQAVLLPIPIAVWAILQMRHRAFLLLAVLGITGLVVFFAFWPYLWNAPLGHLREYLGRTTNRAAIQVWYFGRAMADRDVPWHYPWVMFLSTVPIGLHLLGGLGVCGGERRAWETPRERLLLACAVFPLVVFSVPGVAVYDGERLFSIVFPLWALLIGRGAEIARLALSSRVSPRAAALALAIFLAGQGYGLFAMAPSWLSYYNVLVGGLPGAAKLGLEISYWGDGVTRTFLKEAADRVPAGETIAVLPVLYDAQWNELRLQSPILRARDLRLVPFGSKETSRPRYVLLFMRPEYLPMEFRLPLDESRVLTAVSRQGIPLAVLLEKP